MNTRRIAAIAATIWGLLALTPAWSADAVTRWTLLADQLGDGNANWRTLAIMHMAMHDAWNTADPVYARWAPPEPGEPRAAGALPDAAIAGAAAQVLLRLHPSHRAEVERVLHVAVSEIPDTPARKAGLKLGDAIGAAAVARRRDDGYNRGHVFVGHEGPGRWKPTPPGYFTSVTTDSRPYLFARLSDFHATPPNQPGSAAFLREVAETRHMGALEGSGRTAEQTYAAKYWAYQSPQRGYLLLAVSLLDEQPRPGGLGENARVMAQLTVALAESSVMAWAEKDALSSWRPVTVINQGGFGVAADPHWQALLDTPPFPEYPSAHASDCFIGAGYLASVFGQQFGPIRYVAQSAMPAADMPMPGATSPAAVERSFPNLPASAQDCADSRIWAGAHFRSANEESHRLAAVVVARALATVPPLAQ